MICTNALLSGTEMEREKKIALEVISILWMQTHSEVFLQNFIMTVCVHYLQDMMWIDLWCLCLLCGNVMPIFCYVGQVRRHLNLDSLLYLQITKTAFTFLKIMEYKRWCCLMMDSVMYVGWNVRSLFLIHCGMGCWGCCFNHVPWNNLTLISRKY